MRINWIVANNAQLDPTVDLDAVKNIGPIWGGWQTWRTFGTDNVICCDYDRAVTLLKRDFQVKCNLYLPESAYQSLDRPQGVRLYGGEFTLEFANPEEIVSMHLALTQSDIILLYGFDWKEQHHSDRLIQHQHLNYRNLVGHLIKDNPGVQWVLVDHTTDLDPYLAKLENLTKDSLDNVFSMLSS